MIIEISEDNLDILTTLGNELPLREFMLSHLRTHRIIQSFLSSPISKFDVKMVDGVLTGTRKENK
jgi:hypothetical protein